MIFSLIVILWIVIDFILILTAFQRMTYTNEEEWRYTKPDAILIMGGVVGLITSPIGILVIGLSEWYYALMLGLGIGILSLVINTIIFSIRIKFKDKKTKQEEENEIKIKNKK